MSGMSGMSGMSTSCRNDRRRDLIRAREAGGRAIVIGLDYLEVREDQVTLEVYFIGRLPPALRENRPGLEQFVRIEGGVRILDIQVVDVDPYVSPDPESDDVLIVRLDKAGDFSTYTLRLIGLDGIDPRYGHLDFSFKINCPSDLDCALTAPCPPPARPTPEINYLAKDYASFRQIILDRLALIMPDWKERHVPDLGIALVEVLAYAGDHLSYYQDAVATEAYLDTARQRISVRRHAKLVDYAMHEGCNARAWVCVETNETAQRVDVRHVHFVTGLNDALPFHESALIAAALQDTPRHVYEVFEPVLSPGPIGMHAEEDAVEINQVTFRRAHNAISFYTWGGRECCLLRGATSATLRDVWLSADGQPGEGYGGQPMAQQAAMQATHPPASDQPNAARALDLKKGDVLIFEEVIGPKTGQRADADLTRRHAVRLTRATPAVDPVTATPVVEIEWSDEDRLPFMLCLSVVGPVPACDYMDDVSVARGNVLLVDHGRTVRPPEGLGIVPTRATEVTCECEGHPGEVTYFPGPFQPRLENTPLTFRAEILTDASAGKAIQHNPRAAVPQIWVTSKDRPGIMHRWRARPDLLDSRLNDHDFVVEVDNDRVARLRFGDGELGRRPAAGEAFAASYRVGNGAAGNVGAEAISRLVIRSGPFVSGLMRVRNPLPAGGGVEPEPIAEVKLFAPSAFRKAPTGLKRAITADDYARLAERESDARVQRAAAVLRWTGSWYEADVAIDPLARVQDVEPVLAYIHERLEDYRRIGHDLAVRQAKRVPLHVELEICVRPDYLTGHVKAALLDAFSARSLPDGRLGIFHPDNLTFGQSIRLSKLVAVAQAVTGVESVQINRLNRLFEAPNGELESGVLPLGPLEVAQLDNDPGFPERGRLVLEMKGGR